MAPTRRRYVLSAEATATALAVRRTATPELDMGPSPKKKSSLAGRSGIIRPRDSPKKGLRVVFEDAREATPNRLQQHADAANAQLQADDKAGIVTEHRVLLDTLFLTVYTEAMLDFLLAHYSSSTKSGQPTTLALQALMLWVDVNKFNTAALIERSEGDDALDPCQLAYNLHERARLVSIYHRVCKAKRLASLEDRDHAATVNNKSFSGSKAEGLLGKTLYMLQCYEELYQDFFRLGDIMTPVGVNDRLLAFTLDTEVESYLTQLDSRGITKAFVINRDRITPENQADQVKTINAFYGKSDYSLVEDISKDMWGWREKALNRLEELQQRHYRTINSIEGLLTPKVGKSRIIIEAEKRSSRKATLRRYTKHNAEARAMREAMRGDSRICTKTGEIWRHEAPAVLPFGTTPAAIRYQSDAIFIDLKDTEHANTSVRPTKPRVAPKKDGKFIWAPQIPLPILEEGPFLAIAAIEMELNAQRGAEEGTAERQVEAEAELGTEDQTMTESIPLREKVYPPPVFSLLSQKKKQSSCAMM